jgi:hypothetical protein
MNTIKDLASQFNVSKTAVRKWVGQATDKYGELDKRKVGQTYYYTPQSIEQIVEFARAKPVQGEIVDVDEAPRTVFNALLTTSVPTASSIVPLSLTTPTDNTIALARQGFQSRQDLDTAIQNTASALEGVKGLAETLGTSIAKQFGAELREKLAQGLDTEIKGVLEQFGLK